MNRTTYVFPAIFMLFGIFSLQHCASSSALPSAKTFIEALQQQKNATTYMQLIEGAGGLANVLGKEKYTLVVPIDAAFNTLGIEALLQLMAPDNMAKATETLKGHILVGTFSPETLAKSSTLPTLNGKTIAVQSGSIGGAAIVQSVKTKEGYVHFVGSLLK